MRSRRCGCAGNVETAKRGKIMEMTRILAALLSAFMLLGLAACGQGMPDYLAEVQKVNEWKCYEMNVDLALDFQAELDAGASELLFGTG